MRFHTLAALCALLVLGAPQTSLAQEQSTRPGGSSAALTNQDIVLMAKSQFDDATIEKMIQTHEANFDLSVAGLVKLKDAGVAQGVIQAMLATTAPHTDGRHPDAAAIRPKSASEAPDGALSREQQAQQLQPGTYYWSRGSWRSMQQLTMSGGGAKHVAKVFVPGLTPQMVWTFREPNAPIQISESQPLFCVRFFAMPPGMPFAPSPRDITIARFDEKRDHRELQITSGGNMLTFKSGLGKDRLPDLTVNSVDATTVFFTPTAPLRAGEYIISTTSMGMTGYDFGFHPER